MNDEPSDIEIDIARLRELIQEYQSASSRATQRRIENEVLSETVWRLDTDRSPTIELDESQIRHIYRALPDDAKHAKQILRSHFFNDM